MNEPREHLLISKIVDGDASDREWQELASLAENNTSLWRELAEAQHDQAALSKAVARAAAVADAVGLESPRHLAAGLHAEPKRTFHLNRVSSWSGWAVAALVVIVASVRLAQFTRPSFQAGGNTAQQTGLMPITSAADAFQAYLDKGRASGEVIGEMPAKVLVESRPNAGGTGFEIVFLRQVLERTIVPELYHVDGHNELGQPTLVRYQHPQRGSM